MSDDKVQLSPEQEILEDAKKFIASRSASAIGVVGKAAMYDTKSHSNHDFTASGMLETRWVNMDPTAIAKRRQQGYVFPSEVSSKLPDHQMKNQALMVIPKERRAQLREQVNQITQRFEGAVFNKDIKGRAASDKKGGVMEKFEVTTPDGAPTSPTTLIPQDRPKKAIGAK